MNLDAIKDFKVLFVGDAILDEYQYVTTIGKSIKEPVISTKMLNREKFRGGVWAAAAHLHDLCSFVDVMTGDRLMVNTRFVDPIYTRKLFTMHEDKPIAAAFPFAQSFPSLPVSEYDAVIVTDFGHGAMTQPLIDRLTAEAKFLAINTQTNSQNYGFNLVTKYERADFVVLDELEARLSVHDRDSAIEDVIRKMDCKKIIVTRGALGAIGYAGEFHSEPAGAVNVVDTMGAGDAVLAVSAPFAAAGFPIDDLVRIGNAAGAIKIQIIGHRQHVTRQALEERLAL